MTVLVLNNNLRLCAPALLLCYFTKLSYLSWMKGFDSCVPANLKVLAQTLKFCKSVNESPMKVFLDLTARLNWENWMASTT